MSPLLRNWVLDSGLKAAALFLRHIEVPPTSHEATSASLAVTPSILQEDAGWAAVAGLGFLGAMLGVVPRPGKICHCDDDYGIHVKERLDSLGDDGIS
ncbi:hypothetical protein PVAP13_6KG185742 [Panicum virgatum]|uniref:Uncharacterized protein n=1 Tax=Panicum virgatum TaxID=38727 RepID=A0A8T0R9Z7_PANVG|nr:hypothetical protein PVAP13_6KG185742 [Panicum virgatum]